MTLKSRINWNPQRNCLAGSCDDNHTICFGAGHLDLDRATGAPIAITNDSDGQRRYLLDDDVPWHSNDHYWGTGYVTTTTGGSQWVAPKSMSLQDNSQSLQFDLPDTGLVLRIERTGGERLTERFEWVNASDATVTVTGLGIQTPFNDRYPGSVRALTQCVNAHVFAGGAWSWALVKPMDAHGDCLGLIVRQGAINAYSIQSRNYVTSSNIRGHIVLQVTDQAVNPTAFGGQPVIEIKPGESYILRWELGWYPTSEDFVSSTHAPATFSRLSSPIGDDITISSQLAVRAKSRRLEINAHQGLTRVTSGLPGTYQLELGEGVRRSHTEVLFHKTLRQTVSDRVQYILAHQIARERTGTLSAAMVATDTRTGTHVIDAGWSDWSDGSERIAMPVLLQRAVNLRFVTGQLARSSQEAVDSWRDFAEEFLLDNTGACRRGSREPTSAFGRRPYDVSWFVNFYTEHYIATKDVHDLDMVVRILDRAAQLGGEHFLAIEFAETSQSAIRLLEQAGREEQAERLRRRMITSADFFLARGTDLPPHEVSYEQSMVAPLTSLLIGAYRISGSDAYLDGIRERLGWLLSFSGPQPDSRLYGIGIRHWDDFWFGIDRQFGDVFPHYWSSLTAEVLLRLPEPLRTERTDALAYAILEANLANFNDDGSATCAYVFPSSVDGRAMHTSDPLANDQDWHLNIWLRLIAEEGCREA